MQTDTAAALAAIEAMRARAAASEGSQFPISHASYVRAVDVRHLTNVAAAVVGLVEARQGSVDDLETWRRIDDAWAKLDAALAALAALATGVGTGTGGAG